MNVYAGLWIDHRKAVMAIVTNCGEEMHEILSQIERSARIKDGMGFGLGSKQDMRDRKFWTRSKCYYNSIITVLRVSRHDLDSGSGRGDRRARMAS